MEILEFYESLQRISKIFNKIKNSTYYYLPWKQPSGRQIDLYYNDLKRLCLLNNNVVTRTFVYDKEIINKSKKEWSPNEENYKMFCEYLAYEFYKRPEDIIIYYNTRIIGLI